MQKYFSALFVMLHFARCFLFSRLICEVLALALLFVGDRIGHDVTIYFRPKPEIDNKLLVAKEIGCEKVSDDVETAPCR